MGYIFFHYQIGRYKIPATARIKKIVEDVFHMYKKELERVDYIFCSDDYLLDVNKKFLQHDYYTDIITFSLNKPGTPIISEIYISVDRVKENAKKYEVPVQSELLRVIIHGALHLCGFKDDSAKKKSKMTKQENRFMEMFDVPRKTVSG